MTEDNQPDSGLPTALPGVSTNATTARTAEEPSQTPVTKAKSLSPLQKSLQRFSRDKRAMISLGILLSSVLLALLGPVIYTHLGAPITNSHGKVLTSDQYRGPFYLDLDHQNETFSALHWLGTDSTGHDLLARVMASLLVSIGVAISVEVVNITLGIFVGVLAGYYGGIIDQLLARFTDLTFAFPSLLFAILLTGIFGTGADTVFGVIPIIGQNGNARLLLVSLALALTSWPLMARYVRGQTLQLKQQQFVEAAKMAGSTNINTILRHIIPNLFSIVIIASTLNISNTIIGEAGLSALGLGVQSPGSSLGVMISSEVGTLETGDFRLMWQLLLPCIVLSIIILAFSFIGDGIRDAFDPRTKD
jgi:peptide/nickel transport system permease protein